jgi:hypothetical protein
VRVSANDYLAWVSIAFHDNLVANAIPDVAELSAVLQGKVAEKEVIVR